MGLGGSQFSEPVSTPSPQSGTHGRPGTRHCQPGVTAMHPMQPPDMFVPSSHASVRERKPSPQTGAGTHGWPGTHIALPSVWHALLQPSPPTLFPSSPCSPMWIGELPQLLGVMIPEPEVFPKPAAPALPLFPPLPSSESSSTPVPLVLPGPQPVPENTAMSTAKKKKRANLGITSPILRP